MITTRPVPQQERSRRTVANILDAAARVFDRDGFTAATMTSVAAEAGVGIASLYSWFPSKDDLVAGLTESHLADSAARLGLLAVALREQLPDAETVVESYISAVVAANAGSSRFHRELFDRFPGTDEVLAKKGELEQAASEEVSFHLDRLGLGRMDTDLTARILTAAVGVLVHDVILAEPAGPRRQSAQREVHALVMAYLQTEV